MKHKPDTNHGHRLARWQSHEGRLAAFHAAQKREALLWLAALLCLIAAVLIWYLHEPLSELIKSLAVVSAVGLGVFTFKPPHDISQQADDELPKHVTPAKITLPRAVTTVRTVEMLGLHHPTGLFRVRSGDDILSAPSRAEALGRMVEHLHHLHGPVTIELIRP